jgi:hypothetical protein
MMRSTSFTFVFAWTVACAAETPSTCYAPAAHDYRSQVRTIGQLPSSSWYAFALPDGRAVAVTVAIETPEPSSHYAAFMIDPADDTVEQVAAWDGSFGPMTLLDDGRLFLFESGDCSYVLVELEEGSATRKPCSGDGFNAELVWQRSRSELLLFGSAFREGIDSDGVVFSLDLGTSTLARLDVAVDDGFARTPDAPFPLCDGRLVFPHTQFNDGDFLADAPAVHYYDPAQRELTTVALPFAPDRAAQLDAGTALLIGRDNDGEIAHVLDLDAGTSRPVGLPDEAVHPMYEETLVGLADGTALVVGMSGALHIFSPDSEQFTRLAVRFAGEPRRLLRLSTGAVLAFTGGDNAIELFE